MLIDRYLPVFDVTQVCETEVDASPSETYDAIRRADLRSSLINALFTIREIPLRIARRWRGERPPRPSGPVTFGKMIEAGPGFTILAEEPDVELVVGSVGRFWQRDYGGRPVSREDFAHFAEPGYAKLAIGLSVRPSPSGGTIIRYEARTATTDEKAKRTFGRYWGLIHYGVRLVMESALRHIKT